MQEKPTGHRWCVYFIQSGEYGPIKIGRTKNLARRFSDLQIGSAEPLRFIGAVPGGIELERELQDRFWQYHLHGEWFEPVPEVLAFAWSAHEIKGRRPALVDADKGFGARLRARLRAEGIYDEVGELVASGVIPGTPGDAA